MSVSCLRYNLKRNSFMIEKYTIFTDYLREKFPRYDTYLSEISDSSWLINSDIILISGPSGMFLLFLTNLHKVFYNYHYNCNYNTYTFRVS